MIANSKVRQHLRQAQAKRRRMLAQVAELIPEIKDVPADEAGIWAPGSDPKRPLLSVTWRRALGKYMLNR